MVHRWSSVGAFGVLLLAAGLRFWGLDAFTLWGDEGYSWALALSSPAGIFRATSVDVHPPLYYLLLHFWVTLAGSSEYALRFVSATSGVLSVALLLRWGRLVGGACLLLLGGLIGAVAPMWVHYAQEARMYALETLASLAATVLLYAILQRTAAGALRAVPWSWWLAYALTAALSLWLDYFPAFVLLAHNLMVVGGLLFLPRSERRPLLGRWLLAQASVLLLYAPWIILALGENIAAVGGSGAPAFREQVVHLWRSFVVGSWLRDTAAFAPTLPPLLEAPLLLAFAVLPLWGFLSQVRAWRQGRSSWTPWYLAISFGAPLIAYLLVVALRPQFHPRYLLVATPSLYLLVAMGLSRLQQQRSWLFWLGSVLCFATLALGLGARSTTPSIPRGNARLLQEFLAAQVAPGDLILVEKPLPTEYEAHYYIDHAASRTGATVVPVAIDPAGIPSDLMLLIQRSPRVMWMSWLRGSRDYWGLMPYLLERLGHNVGDVARSIFRLQWYDAFAEQPINLEEITLLAARFGDILQIEGVAYGGEEEKPALPSGEAAWILLRGHALQAISGHLKTSWRLADEQGQVIVQEDRFLYNHLGLSAALWQVGDPIAAAAVLRIPVGTAPGSYTLQVTVYRVSDAASAASSAEILPAHGRPALPLGPLQVEPARRIPSPEELAIPQRLSPARRYGDLELLGFALDEVTSEAALPLTLRAGDPLALILFWRAYRAPSTEQLFRLRLMDSVGILRYQWERGPTGGQFPLTQWRAGEVVIDRHRVILPAGLDAGTYTLDLEAQDGSTQLLGSLLLEDRSHTFEQPRPSHPFQATLGATAELLGYDVEGSAASGAMLAVTLHWRARSTPSEQYAVFVHLSDAEDRLWAQHDGPPMQGLAPTTSWLPGEVLTDRHALLVPAGAPAGTYWLYAGLYDPKTGQRLLSEEGSDRLRLGRVAISQP